MWQYVGNLTLFYYICAALHRLSFSESMVPWNWSLLIHVPTKPVPKRHLYPPFRCHKHQHYISRPQPCVQPSFTLQPFHWLFSIFCLNMCKPVEPADGESVKKTLGLWQHVFENYRTTKSRSDKWERRDRIEKKFLQMHATNNHSDIIFLSVKISADGVPVGCLTASGGALPYHRETW